MSEKNNMIAHYKGGGSDKVYLACVRENPDGTWSVIGKYGRRGRNLQSQVKASGVDEFTARNEQRKLFQSKLNKKFYKDVEEDPAYDGTVRRVDTALQPHLEPEISGASKACRPPLREWVRGTPPKKTPPKKAPPKKGPHPSEDVEVKCVDDSGIDDRFDLGISYIAETHVDADMIWVFDKLGNKGEFFKNRFQKV